MIKVFLADDEIYVIELLLHLIDWKAMGLEIVGTSNDGRSALEKIRLLVPDIVITDIRMPGIDGLKLIEEAQKTNPNTAFIIISGHKTFEYAQNALQFGVKDYILKPILEDDLVPILSRVVDEINLSKSRSDAISKMNQNLSTAKAMMRTSLLDTIIRGNTLPYDSIQALNHSHVLEFSEGDFLFILFKLDSKSVSTDIRFDGSLRQELIRLIKEYVQPLCHEALYQSLNSKFYLLCNYETEKSDELSKNLKLLFNSFEQNLHKYESLYFTLCRGSIQSDVNQITKSFQDAQHTMRSRIFFGLNTVLYPPDNYSSGTDIETILSSEKGEQLSRSFERFDESAIKLQITQLFAIAEAYKINQADFYWDLSMEIYHLFLHDTQHFGLFEDINEEKSSFSELLEDCISVNSIKALLIQRILEHINTYKNKYESNENVSITVAKKYIAEHYMDKITLAEIAQQLFINPVYFSILFKRETGINFVDYLNKFRIEESKKKLKDFSISISEVSYAVGFANAKYFSKMFKRIVGITPSQYRRKHIRHHTENSVANL